MRSKNPINKPRATLDRVLSKAGMASRSDSRQWIEAGRVKVNGKVIRNPDHWITREADVVHLDGMRVDAVRKIYVVLNKPTGVITSREDRSGRPTVYDCIGDLGRWVFPVGRLDMDTSGLILLTNDSAFAEAVLDPLRKVPKTYYAKVRGLLDADDYFRLAFGLDIGRGEVSGPAVVRELRHNGRDTWIELVITEGKNRQVRRMCSATGHDVLKLVRTRIGGFDLGDLPVGQYRKLSPEERGRLMRRAPSGGLRQTMPV